MTNRILQYLNTCPCQRAERLSERWREVAEQIESAIGNDLVEVMFPGPGTFLDDAKETSISVWYHEVLTIAPITSLADAPEHVIDELRRIAIMLSAAADRLDGREVWHV